MKIQINDRTYDSYKAIFKVLVTHIHKLYPAGFQIENPIERLERWEQENRPKAKQALKMGVHDLLAQMKEVPPAQREEINLELAANNLPSLRELQGASKKIRVRILKRQEIKTMEEYYLVIEELSDMSNELTEADRVKLGELVSLFEKKHRSNGADN